MSYNSHSAIESRDLAEIIAPLDHDLAIQLLVGALKERRSGRFLDTALPLIADTLDATYVAISCPSDGTWQVLSEAGRQRGLPVDLLGEALDRETPTLRDGWLAVPLVPRDSAGRCLLVRFSDGGPGAPEPARLLGLARLLGYCLDGVHRQGQMSRRIERLEAILEIASHWNRTAEMEPLLRLMAQASCRLLAADRASIFLWDRRSHTLLGRPALGVEGGELRIPDDAGVVGQVVRTGESARVGAAAGQERINREVDTQLGYQTQTLLCVPLRGRGGEILGAFEMVNKLEGDFTDEDEAALLELAEHASTALENAQQRQALMQSRQQIANEAAQHVQLIGNSPAIEALRSTIRRVAMTDLAVLILGENGTGKEVVSQLIHYLSDRRQQPFIAVNCAAISESLIESELFGHEKGAFTDAREARPGKFELADGGTLFLDEIGDLSPAGQAKLLRVLEEKVVVRVGGSRPIPTDARVIAATNQDLAAMVREKKFREDLYFRLNVVALDLPPLRERQGDVLLLAQHFLETFCRRVPRPALELSPEAAARLAAHPWPGNVRELRNLAERLAYLHSGERIEAADLAFSATPHAVAAAPDELTTLTEATDLFQADYIRRAIAAAGGNVSQAASQLGLHRSNLYRKMRLLGMEGQRG